jgi:diguanylate cyclase (GGDEF)-like protein
MAARKALLVALSPEEEALLRTRLEALNFEVATVADAARALPLLENPQLDLVLCHRSASQPGPRELCDYLQDFGEAHLPFIVLAPAGEPAPEALRRESGADAVLRIPTDLDLLGVLAGLLGELHALEARVQHLRAENTALREDARPGGLIDPATRFYRFDLFKQVMLLEVKRAQRYGYPLSTVLVAFDNVQQVFGWLSQEQRRGLYAQLSQAVTAAIRDIDIPLLFAEDKVLVVLPHTPLSGAAVVADRIRAGALALPLPASLAALRLSVSVAVAATGGPGASFGRLIQTSMRALRKAAAEGGDRVLICRDPDAPDQAQACLDAGGKLGDRTFIL